MPVVVRTRDYGTEASYASLAAPNVILSAAKNLPSPSHQQPSPLMGEGQGEGGTRGEGKAKADPAADARARRQRDMDALFGDPLQ
jgi:hypothetical protein